MITQQMAWGSYDNTANGMGYLLSHTILFFFLSETDELYFNKEPESSTMAMDTKPRHMLHMAAKYEFISQSIKTGSFVSLFVFKI